MAKTATYALIESKTLGSATSSIAFTSIPAIYTDLLLVCNYGLSADADSRFYLNNESTGTNYSMTNLRGNGSTAVSSRYSSNDYFVFGLQSVTVPTTLTSTAIYHFLDYANSTTYKTVIGTAGDAAAQKIVRVGTWRASPTAINRIDIAGVSANLLSGSTFKLYGIQAGNA